MPQNGPKLNDTNDLLDFSGRLSGLILDFLALDGLEARILWHQFLKRNRVPQAHSQAGVRKFCSKWENSRLSHDQKGQEDHSREAHGR